MSDQSEGHETSRRLTPGVPTDDQSGSVPPSRGSRGDGQAGVPDTTSPKHRRSRVLVGLVVAFIVVACGVGVGIGYAVHGTSTTLSTPPTSPSRPSGSPSSEGTPNVSAIVAEVTPDLVNINTTLAYETARGAGTGMVVTSSGRIITNNHVIDGATTITATDLGNGKTYDASVVGYDAAHDVAVLQLNGATGLSTATLAGSSARLGDTVVAIGNAGGRGTPTAAAGVITGLNQTITAQSELSGTSEHLSGLIETNAAIEAGQSGGPLVNANARVVGMVTAGSSNFTFSQSANQGYAVPATTFLPVVTDIVNGNESTNVHIGPTAFLGVRTTSVQEPGALVVQVVGTSPAALAGVLPGDLIVGLGGQTVSSPETVASVLATYRPGAQIRVNLVDQAGAQRTVTVTLANGPPA